LAKDQIAKLAIVSALASQGQGMADIFRAVFNCLLPGGTLAEMQSFDVTIGCPQRPAAALGSPGEPCRE
jgi:hypothetical protein